MKDPYGLLGVRRGASREEIRHAYRKLVRVHHPDLNPEDPGAEERFKKLQSAYEAVLHDDVRRENSLKQPRTAKTTGETNSRERDREFFRDELSRILLRAGFTAGGGSGVGSSNLREMDVYRLLRRFGSDKGNASKIRPDFGDAAGFDRSAADVKAKFPNFSKVSKESKESKKPPKPPKPPRPPKW